MTETFTLKQLDQAVAHVIKTLPPRVEPEPTSNIRQADVVSNELPSIIEVTRRIDSTGYVIEERTLQIKGPNLSEIKTIRDQIRSERAS